MTELLIRKDDKYSEYYVLHSRSRREACENVIQSAFNWLASIGVFKEIADNLWHNLKMYLLCVKCDYFDNKVALEKIQMILDF